MNISEEELEKQVKLFSESLDRTNYLNALKIQSKLEQNHIHVSMPAVNTSEIYEESFKMDKLTSYGLVDDKITTIKGFEDNLNTNPTNKQHLEAFIK